MPAPPTWPVAAPRPMLGGRYTLETRIGRGGWAEVWRATDAATGSPVAIKIPHAVDDELAERTRREVAALRLVRQPGVVPLLDVVVEDGRACVVMALVTGTPFPGRAAPVSWEELAPVARGLLEALGGVHLRGVVHRDLKPANVLVDGERVTLLDFGIARGAALGSTMTHEGWLGTPSYLAPEQLGDGVVDARADLYAAGVLLFEALSGRLPFRGVTDEVLAARVVMRAPPLVSVADVPDGIGAVIDRLLRTDPDDRFRDASEVLAALSLGGRRTLPWIGRREVVDTLVAAARAGRSAELGGTPGSGRTRILDEVAAVLGPRVHRVGPGRRGLESLSAFVEDPSAEDAPEACREALREALASGAVLLVDTGVDRVSRSILAEVGGAVIRVAEPGPSLPVEVCAAPPPLTEEDLRTLFHGPELVRHLVTDAARALYLRTAGHPGRVAAELETWVLHGVARWDGARLHVDRDALHGVEVGAIVQPPVTSVSALEPGLDELLGWVQVAGRIDVATLAVAARMPAWEVRHALAALSAEGAVRALPDGAWEAVVASRVARAWPDDERIRVHARLAAALQPGSLGRLAHLARAGAADALADEAVLVGDRLVAEGRVRPALAVLEAALQGVRGSGAREAALARSLALAALAEGSVTVLRRLRYTLDPIDRRIARLLDAFADTQGGAAPHVVPEFFGDDALDAWWHTVAVRARTTNTLAEAEAYIHSLPTGSPLLERRRRAWLGHVRFLGGRYVEAAALHREATLGEPEVSRRAGGLVNAGLALREAYAYEEALACFLQAVEFGEQYRLPTIEAHARLGARGMLYRLDRAGAPDLALVDAVATLEMPGVTAQMALCEALIAWRRKERDLARRLAERAVTAFGAGTLGRAYGVALAAACGAAVDTAWVYTASPTQVPLAAFQLGALLGEAGEPEGYHWAARALEALGPERWETREAVWSRAEVAERIRGGGGGG